MKHLSKYVIVVIALVLGMMAVSSVFAAGPTGTSPDDPLLVPTGAQTIAPNTTQWFYFDYAFESTGRGARFASKVSVAVDANGMNGLQFAIYTPTQAKSWLSDPTTSPVGRGTPYMDTSYDVITRDLYWAGAFNSSGRYFVAVTNNAPAPITFRLTVTGDTVTLYPPVAPTPTPTLYVPVTVTPVPAGSIQGRILFETQTGGAIFSVNGDGSNLTLISRGIDPAWSPDGKQIIFTRWDNVDPGVFIANADGSNERNVFGTPRARWARMSPDGKYVVFSMDKSKSETNIIWKLGVVEIATGKLLEPQCARLCLVPSWGSDSVTVVFTDPSVGIQATNIFAGPASLVLGPTGMYWDTSKNAAMPILAMPAIQNSDWSSDGKRVVYSQPAHDRWEVSAVNVDGGNQAAVTTFDPIEYYLLDHVVRNVTPTWSPDNQQILFLSDRNGKWEFFVANADGSNVKQVLKSVTDLVPIKFSFENERIMDWAK